MTRIAHEFFYRRLSVLGLARKHGKTVKQIEALIRRETRRP